MSRIFDALQRSGTEQSGIEYPDLISMVTEVFEAPREQRPITDPPIAPEPAPTQPALLRSISVQSIPVQSIPVPPISVQPISDQPVAVQSVTVQPTDVQTTTTDPFTKEVTGDGPLAFPSLDVLPTTTSRLVFMTEPDSLGAEKFRFLGVRLRQLQQSRPLKKVLVTSTIPEEGKSTVSANLAGVL